MESKTLNLIGKIIIGIIAVIAVIFFIPIIRNPHDSDTAIDGMITFTKFVLIITIIIATFVWVKDIVTHPKKLVQTAISAGIFLLVVLIAKYALASNKAADFGKHHIDAGTSNWIDTGLYTFYILGAVAVLLMFISPVLSMFAPNATANAVGEIEEEIDEMIDDDDNN